MAGGAIMRWLTGGPITPVSEVPEVRQGSEFSAGGDSPLTGVIPPSRSTGPVEVTARQALTLPTVYRCVSIISTSVSQLPVGVWRYGAEIPVGSANNNGWLNRPDLSVTQHRFIERTVVSLAVSGNAYWRVKRLTAADPINEIEVLNPHNVLIERTDSGRLIYNYGDKKFTEDEIKHLRLLDVPGSEYGLGPIQAANPTLRGAIDLTGYADAWFRTGQTPNGVLSVKGPINADMAAQYKAAWESFQASAQGVAVLGSETTYQPIYLKPADAQFLESQQFSASQVARMFGVPPSKLLVGVEGSSLTYANVESLSAEFVRDTLTSYIREIEEAFTDLLPRGQTCRFKLDAFLRGDQSTRFAGYATAISAGFLTVDEVRALEGLPPLPAGDQTSPDTAPPQQEQA